MADINCYGVIKDGFADNLRRAVSKVPAHEPIELHISSPGGILGEGVTAYNVLKRCPNEVLAYLDGDAFSAATLLVCAANHTDMPSNCLMMIHEPWLPGGVMGTIDEIGRANNYLKATKKQAIDIYHDKTGKPKRTLSKLMKQETYFTAHEALGVGFVSNVSGPSDQVENMPLDSYAEARNKDALASMLQQRHIVRSDEELGQILANICKGV